MTAKMILTGDVNLMNVADPTVAFARMQDEFAAADVVFGNLKCCLYEPPEGHSFEHEGFFADPAIGGEALRLAAFAAAGLANNVNYGSAAILASIARLDRLARTLRRRHRPQRGAGAGARRARRVARRLSTAQLGVLADQSRGRRPLSGLAARARPCLSSLLNRLLKPG